MSMGHEAAFLALCPCCRQSLVDQGMRYPGRLNAVSSLTDFEPVLQCIGQWQQLAR